MKKILFTLAVATFALISCGNKDIIEERFLASATTEVTLYSIDENGNVSEAQTMVRGRKVKANYGKGVKVEKQKYYPIEITRKQYFYAKEQSLVATTKEVVKEKTIWVRTPASIITDCATSLIGGHANKGEQLEVLDFDSLREDGRVNRYKVKQGNLEGYVYGKYLVFDKAEAEKDTRRSSTIRYIRLSKTRSVVARLSVAISTLPSVSSSPTTRCLRLATRYTSIFRLR